MAVIWWSCMNGEWHVTVNAITDDTVSSGRPRRRKRSQTKPHHWHNMVEPCLCINDVPDVFVIWGKMNVNVFMLQLFVVAHLLFTLTYACSSLPFSVSYFYHLTVIRNVNAVRETNQNKDRIMTCDTKVRDGKEREGPMRRHACQKTQKKRTSAITPIGELDGCYAVSGNPPRMWTFVLFDVFVFIWVVNKVLSLTPGVNRMHKIPWRPELSFRHPGPR